MSSDDTFPCACCGPTDQWWCILGDNGGCAPGTGYTVTTGTIGGTGCDMSCSAKTYYICQDIGGTTWSGFGGLLYEDPMSPGDWLFDACGFTYGFPGFDFIEQFGGHVNAPADCDTNVAAHIYQRTNYCFHGTEAAATAEAAGYGPYGYTGSYASEAACNTPCLGTGFRAASKPAEPTSEPKRVIAPAAARKPADSKPGAKKDCGCGKPKPDHFRAARQERKLG